MILSITPLLTYLVELGGLIEKRGAKYGWKLQGVKEDCEELLPTSESNLTFRSGKLSKRENTYYGCGSIIRFVECR